MMQCNYEKLANNLVTHSTSIKKGENVLIDVGSNIPPDMVVALVNNVYDAGGYPFIELKDATINKALIKRSSENSLKQSLKVMLHKMKNMDAYIAIRGTDNPYNMSDISTDITKRASKILRPATDYIVKKTKWCILSWPTNSMAQSAKMSTEEFTEFYFNVCCYDYHLMEKEARKLKKLMEKTDQVRITGPDTDLSFSIKDIPAIECCGNYNIPDGEVFTAPAKNSVNGIVTFNCLTTYNNQTFNGICLEFKNGKIIKATCKDGDETKLNEILDTDKGSRYIGEFALGINPHITKPMNDILFDEKIFGSFHFTPGACYDEASNKNKSSVHWDMVCIQTPEYGGGEIYFDNKLIRKDGNFVPKSLQSLNTKT